LAPRSPVARRGRDSAASPSARAAPGTPTATRASGSSWSYPPLGLPALGSFLWSAEAIPDLAAAELANHDLLDAVRALAFAAQDRVRRPVDYRNLGSEELGSVYESLLEPRELLRELVRVALPLSCALVPSRARDGAPGHSACTDIQAAGVVSARFSEQCRGDPLCLP
jgi:hypothetical protein